MVSSRLSRAPCLPLDLSLSPFLESVSPTIVLTPCMDDAPATSHSSQSKNKRQHKRKGTCPPRLPAKPLPALPSSPIPPHQIIALLNLLEDMDKDVAHEVKRVKESIKEARLLLGDYREERRARSEQHKAREVPEAMGTGGVEVDFRVRT